MHVAIVGLGEVGRCYVEPLMQAGYQLSVCEAHPSPAANTLVQKLGLTVQPTIGDWLREADWVLSCVTGAVALPVAKQIAPFMRKGAAIADLTTASPDVKRQSADVAAEHGARFVDVAIMGGILINRERTALLASGSCADEFKRLLDPAGARVTAIEGGEIGDAMKLKILRSVFTKGMEALSVELLVSAEKQGVRAKLFEQLQDIDKTPLRDFIEMLVRTHVVHAKRRAHEVHDAQEELRAQGLPSVVLPGVEERFHQTAKMLEVHPHSLPEPSIQQAINWLIANPTKSDA